MKDSFKSLESINTNVYNNVRSKLNEVIYLSDIHLSVIFIDATNVLNMIVVNNVVDGVIKQTSYE